jgi:hypothetical protein
MATPRSSKTVKRLSPNEKRPRKKKSPTKKVKLNFSVVLLFSMVVVGIISGLVAYNFGKQALEGVNPAPVGVKLPKSSPIPQPQESAKPTPTTSPQSMGKGTELLLLDESQVIADFRNRSQAELGNLKRPSFTAIAKRNPRTPLAQTYVKVDRAYSAMRDPLAISASADQRIAQRIAELRQRVYASDRTYVSTYSLDRATLIGRNMDIDRSIDRTEPITTYIEPITTMQNAPAKPNDTPSSNSFLTPTSPTTKVN